MPSSSARHCRQRSWLLAAAVPLLFSCYPVETATDFPHLDGRLFTSEPLYVFPDQHWKKHPEEETWLLYSVGGFHIYVHRQPTEPLAVWFEAEPPTERFHFSVTWDGETYEPYPYVLEEQDSRVLIPTEKLTPGLHHLRLERHYDLDGAIPGTHFETEFRKVGYTVRGRVEGFDWRLPEDAAYLIDFLTRGVAGRSKERLGGFLFHGPQAVELDLRRTRPGRVEFVLENASSEPALFSVSFRRMEETRTVEPGERARLRMPLESGEGKLRLWVKGKDDGLFLWGAPYIGQERPVEPPPLVLITLDTTRRDALTPYGARDDLTPHLQAFAETATLFERAYATSPWTLPSHASMMTGLYPFQHRAGAPDDRLDLRLDTVAELLRQRGYFAGAFAGGYLCHHRYGLGQGFHVYLDPETSETPADRLTASVEAFAGEHRDKPLFLFVNYFDPHAPFRAPREFQRRFEVDRRAALLPRTPVWERLAAGNAGAWRELMQGRIEPTPAAFDYLRAAYHAEVAFMDSQIGVLFELLEAHDLFHRALIAVVADHGELLGEGGRLSHGHSLDPELVEVPLIIKWPHQNRPHRVSTLVSLVDLFPTLLGAAGLPAPEQQGVLLVSSGTAQGPRERGMVYMEEHETLFHPLFPKLKIAPHLYGLQGIAERKIVWREGQSCSTRQGEQWLPAACGESWGESIAEVEALFGGEAMAEGTVRTVGEEEERLRALGYL